VKVKKKNDTNSDSSIASMIIKRIESKLKNLDFNHLFNESDKLKINSIIESLKNDLLLPNEVPEESVWKIAGIKSINY
jgi:uncharacterized protein YaaR (DUF327 family)